MGSNFHTPPTSTVHWNETDLEALLGELDKGITYLKNIIVHCAKEIKYDEDTGVLAWTGLLNILFVREDGTVIRNYVSTGSITLADTEYCYVNLDETNNTALTMQKAALATPVAPGSASNFRPFNRLVLAYRNSTSDKLFSVYLTPYWENVIHKAVTTTDDTETTLMAKTLTEGIACLLNVYVVARQGDTNRAAYIRRALVYRPTGGSATLEGTVQADVTKESDAAWDCTIDVSGNTARVRVTGVAATTITWEGKLEITTVP